MTETNEQSKLPVQIDIEYPLYYTKANYSPVSNKTDLAGDLRIWHETTDNSYH